MEAVNERAIEGLGTTEAQWFAKASLQHIPALAAAAVVPHTYRAVVVAPHPDDEILMVGGVLQQLSQLGRELLLIAVTDGTASHAGSTDWPPQRLARERPLESRAALQTLGLHATTTLRLGLPDGGLTHLRPQLANHLADLLRPADVVFTTWRHDGHPDHEATGYACAAAAEKAGATLIEVPVWAWHWAHPGDVRFPWHRARRFDLDDDTVRRKRTAVQAFVSQLLPDPSTGAGPILRSTTVERAGRSFEMVFV